MRLKDVSRVVCVFAHPDDAEFNYSGTVAKLAGMGAEVDYVVCTDGSRGGSDPNMPQTELADIRAKEQRCAADILGVKNVQFLGYPNGTLDVTLELRRDIVREIRRFRPEVVITHPPRRLLEGSIGVSHPEHIAVGEATMIAVYPEINSPRAYPELLQDGFGPHTVQEVWLPASVDDANLFIDVDDTIEKKIAAIECHQSQIGRQDREPWSFEKDLGPKMATAGARVGSSYAEAFKVVVAAPRRHRAAA